MRKTPYRAIGKLMVKVGSPRFDGGPNAAEVAIARWAYITGQHRSTVAARAEMAYRRHTDRDRGTVIGWAGRPGFIGTR